MIVDGQTHGAIAQGVGQAMWEQCAIDPDSGQPVCGSFMDYGMPRSNTLPSFTTEIVEVLSPTNPLGIKFRRRRRDDTSAGGHRQRDCRRAQRLRRPRRPNAGHAVHRVEIHSRSQGAQGACVTAIN